MTTAKLYFDDLAVGDAFESRELRVEQANMIAFAKQFDPQPFHTDPVAAQDTFFEGLAASGWYTMGITMRLIVESMPLAGGIIGAGAEVSWPRPTRPGDTLRVRSEILALTPSRSRPDRGTAVSRSVTLGQDDEVRQDFTARMIVFRAPGSSG
jgi:acyl dehydratase